MQTIKECQADAARVLFLTYGVGAEMLGFAAASNLDLADEILRRAQPGAVVRGMEAHDGTERDSAEADAAQALFVEHGFSSQWVITESSPAGWGLVNYANFEAYSCKHAAERMANLVIESRRLIPSTAPIWEHCTGGKTVAMQQIIKEELQHVYPDVPSHMLFGQTPKQLTATQEAVLKEYCTEIYRKTIAQHEAFKQSIILRLVAKCAYRMGKDKCTLMTTAQRNAATKGNKDHLAKCLVGLGLSYSEVQPIIRNMVKDLKNV